MRANELAELKAFIAVAEERNFRRAAARLNLTPSTLSHSLRSLEERLGVRLLNRTTRNVSPTDAGQSLLRQIAPAFASIETAVESINAFRAHPSGTVRLNVPLMAATMVLAPVFGKFARDYPDVTLEVSVDDGFVDIVKNGYDAGIRLGESLEQDMIAVRVTPDLPIVVVGSPDYFERHPAPRTPHDLQHLPCVGYREISTGKRCRWEFVNDAGAPFNVAVNGPLVVDTPGLMVSAALDGVGLAFVVRACVDEHLAAGRLVRTLDDWCPTLPGFFLYYFGGRQMSAAMTALVDTVRLSKQDASGLSIHPATRFEHWTAIAHPGR